MRPLLILIVACTAVAAGVQGVRAGDAYDVPECERDITSQACSAAAQEFRRKQFDVPRIEEFKARHAIVRRAFFVDGFGKAMPLVSFIREPGRPPIVQVVALVRDAHGRRQPTVLEGPVTEEIWVEIVGSGSDFDRDLVPIKRPEGDDSELICLHPWQVFVEASEYPAYDGAPNPAKKAYSGCEDGLTIPYALLLARRAVELLPTCKRLDEPQFGNASRLLHACASLKGDTLAAADVLNRIDRDADIFGYDATLDWPGQGRIEGDGASVFWKRQLADASGFDFKHTEFFGEDWRRVRVSGTLSHDVDKADFHLEAPVEQIWTSDGDRFTIHSITVGKFVRRAD